MIGRLVKWLFVLIFLILLVILGYTFLGDFTAPVEEITEPVVIDVD